MIEYTREFDDLRIVLSKPENYGIVYISGVNKEILSNIEYFINSLKIDFFKINAEKLKELDFSSIELPKVILLLDIEYFVRNPQEEKYFITFIEKCIREKKQLLITGMFSLPEIKLSDNAMLYLKHILTIKFEPKEKKGDHFTEIIKTIEPDIPEIKPENNIVEELREEYKAKMYIWKMKGFNTSRIESVIDGNIEAITSEFVSFTADIQRLIELQKRYGILELHMIPEKEKIDIEKKLFDPDSISELEYKISFYEKRATLRNQFKLMLSWDESINNIEVDESNSQIIRFLTSFSLEPYKYKGLNLIRGDRGFGKSTYLNITGIQLFENFKNLVIAYITPHSILNIDDFLNDLSYFDIALFDDIDKVVFRYQKIFSDDILRIIFDMPVVATFTSRGFIDTVKHFEIKNSFEIKEPGMKIKRKMIEKITSDSKIIKRANEEVQKIKGGFYEIENLISNLYYEKKEEVLSDEITEEKKEVVEIKTESEGTITEITEEIDFKEEVKEKVEEKPEAPEKIMEIKEEIQLPKVEKIEEELLEEKIAPEEVKEVKKIDLISEGIVMDIENYNLRIQKEL